MEINKLVSRQWSMVDGRRVTVSRMWAALSWNLGPVVKDLRWLLALSRARLGRP